MALKSGYDWFYPYYRDRALTLMLGMTPYEMLLSAVGSSDDPSSGGRMMPSHWSSPSLHIMNRSSATGMQCLQGAGSADASKRLLKMGAPRPSVEEDEVTYVSIGDGATGEGEFWEFLNTICNEQLPVVCVVEDNGARNLVPRGIPYRRRRCLAPGGIVPALEVIRVDGTRPAELSRAVRSGVCPARKGRPSCTRR
jgi:2-oxoisovalerate dehydrogenase E1 component